MCEHENVATNRGGDEADDTEAAGQHRGDLRQMLQRRRTVCGDLFEDL